LDVVAPEERERTRARIASRFLSGDDDEPFVVDIVDRNGRRRTMEVTSRLLESPGEPPRLEGFARDITDRKRAENALKALAAMTAEGRGEDFFRSMARNLAEALRVTHAMVGSLPKPGAKRIQVLAWWAGDRFGPNATQELADSPAAEVVG